MCPEDESKGTLGGGILCTTTGERILYSGVLRPRAWIERQAKAQLRQERIEALLQGSSAEFDVEDKVGKSAESLTTKSRLLHTVSIGVGHFQTSNLCWFIQLVCCDGKQESA